MFSFIPRRGKNTSESQIFQALNWGKKRITSTVGSSYLIDLAVLYSRLISLHASKSMFFGLLVLIGVYFFFRKTINLIRPLADQDQGEG